MSTENTPHEPIVGNQRLSRRVDVLGVRVSTVNMTRALSTLEDTVDSGGRGYVCVSDVNAVLHASRDDQLREVLNNSLLTVPDGVPLVWSGKFAGARWMGRVSGPDLMPAMLEVAGRRGWSSYFMGGTPDVMEKLLETFRQTIPGFKVAGWSCPPFRELAQDEDCAMISDINESGAELLWVGLGAPKQERWMGEHFPRLTVPLTLGVGGAFDMNAGVIARAPRWMQMAGLEWSFRLSREPRRLWSRYSKNIPTFIWSVVRRPPRLLGRP